MAVICCVPGRAGSRGSWVISPPVTGVAAVRDRRRMGWPAPVIGWAASSGRRRARIAPGVRRRGSVVNGAAAEPRVWHMWSNTPWGESLAYRACAHGWPSSSRWCGPTGCAMRGWPRCCARWVMPAEAAAPVAVGSERRWAVPVSGAPPAWVGHCSHYRPCRACPDSPAATTPTRPHRPPRYLSGCAGRTGRRRSRSSVEPARQPVRVGTYGPEFV